jgi:outer membrane protein assembly factor BamE (lipoprotein component of BamABCDE complex)
MRKGMKHLVILLAGLLICSAGCATPASRIKKNPELFNQLSVEVQTNVLAGRIEVGYSRDAVTLALGEPQRRYTRKTLAGTSTEVWSYTSIRTTTDRQRVDARVRGYDERGRSRTYTDWVYVDVEHRHEFERMRIEFETNTVLAIETLER